MLLLNDIVTKPVSGTCHHWYTYHGCMNLGYQPHMWLQIPIRVEMPITNHFKDYEPNLKKNEGGTIFSHVGR